MTMTESPPTTETSSAAPAPLAVDLYSVLTTTDHKRVGRIWLRSALALLVGVSVLGVLVGVERTDGAGIDVFGGVNSYFQMWSLYRFGLALLVVAPLFIGLATVLVPMQVGATNIAFPRAALSAAWTFVIGASITVISVFAGGGWGALDGVTGDERDAIALTLVGTGMVIVSILLASICIATTVVSLRTSGMTLMRVPLFAWSMLVTTGVWLLTLPIAIANLAIIYVDLRGGPQIFGNPEGSASIYGQLAWVVEQPQIYSFAIPVLGILGSLVPVAAGARHANHSTAVGLIGLFGLLAVGGWSQPFFHDGTEQFIFICFGIVAVVPLLGSIALAAATYAKGEGSGVPLAYLMAAVGGALAVTAGAAAGAARVIEPWHLGGRSTITGILDLVLIGAVASAVAGIWFWAPKIVGSELPPGLGRLVTLDLVGGALLIGIADVVSGFFEADDFMLAAPREDIVDVLSVVSTIGAVIVALGAFGVLAAVVKSMQSGEAAADDPWGGQSLEWATSSPPPVDNFDGALTRVVSESPLLDLADREGGEG